MAKLKNIVAILESFLDKKDYYDPITNLKNAGKPEKFLVYEDRVDNGKKQTRAFTKNPFDDHIEAFKALQGLANAYPKNEYKVTVDNKAGTAHIEKTDGKSSINLYVKASNFYRSPYDMYSNDDSSFNSPNGYNYNNAQTVNITKKQLDELTKIFPEGAIHYDEHNHKVSFPKIKVK